MFCTYRTDTLLTVDMTDILDLFGMHDQVFVLKESEVYKLHVTKESVHKFFISCEIVYEVLLIQEGGRRGIRGKNLQKINSI